MTDVQDSRLYLFAPLPAAVNRFINLSEDLAPAWRTRDLVAMPRRHVTLLDLSVTGEPVGAMIRQARRFITDAGPDAFRMTVDTLVVTERAALLVPSEPVRGALACQERLVRAAGRRGLALPQRAAPKPHVTLGYGYAEAQGSTRIDGISWQVEELRLVLSHHGRTIHETIDHWTLPDARALAA